MYVSFSHLVSFPGLSFSLSRPVHILVTNPTLNGLVAIPLAFIAKFISLRSFRSRVTYDVTISKKNEYLNREEK